MAAPKTIRLDKNEQLSMPEMMRDIYIVLSGQINVIQDSGMNASLAHILSPGRCFGVAFCVGNLPCHHTLKATETSVLLRLSYNGLLDQENTRNKILENLLLVTSENLLVLAEKINHTQARSVRVKVSVFLRDQMRHKGRADFHMEMSRKDMADYLNITYPAMLRELSQMQKEGILKIDGERIIILNAERLIDRGSEYTIL